MRQRVKELQDGKATKATITGKRTHQESRGNPSGATWTITVYIFSLKLEAMQLPSHRHPHSGTVDINVGEKLYTESRVGMELDDFVVASRGNYELRRETLRREKAAAELRDTRGFEDCILRLFIPTFSRLCQIALVVVMLSYGISVPFFTGLGGCGLMWWGAFGALVLCAGLACVVVHIDFDFGCFFECGVRPIELDSDDSSSDSSDVSMEQSLLP